MRRCTCTTSSSLVMNVLCIFANKICLIKYLSFYSNCKRNRQPIVFLHDLPCQAPSLHLKKNSLVQPQDICIENTKSTTVDCEGRVCVCVFGSVLRWSWQGKIATFSLLKGDFVKLIKLFKNTDLKQNPSVEVRLLLRAALDQQSFNKCQHFDPLFFMNQSKII